VAFMDRVPARGSTPMEGMLDNPVSAPARPSLMRVVLVTVAASAVLHACIAVVADSAAYRATYDFSFYYDAALAYRDNSHANIYDPRVLQAAAHAHHVFLGVGVYQYPPLLPLLVMPLTFVGFQTASRIWLFMNVVLWLIGTILLAGLLRRALVGEELPRTRTHVHVADSVRSGNRIAARLTAAWSALSTADLFAYALATFISLTYAPLAQSLELGQASMSIFFLIVLSIWLLRRGSLGWAGAVLGLATMIKLLPIILIAYFVLRGNWRVVGGAIGGIALLLLGIIVALSPQAVLDMGAIPANGASDSMRFQNEALARVPMWIAVALGGHPSALWLAMGYALIGLVAIAFVAGVLMVTRRAVPAEESAGGPSHKRMTLSTLDFLGFGWTLCTMVLVSPIFWEHHAAWLLPALVFCLGYVVHQLSDTQRADEPAPAPGRVLVILCALLIGGYVLTMYALPFAYDTDSSYTIGPYFLHIPLRPAFMLLRPVGAVLLWVAAGALFLLLSKQSRQLPKSVREGTS